MNKFRTGNIVRLKDGFIVIINDYRTIKLKSGETYQVVDWISFDSQNSCGSSSLTTLKYDVNDKETTDETKVVTIEYGMDEAELLATNCKDYIIGCLLKNFEF